jgi:hypothetical protein
VDRYNMGWLMSFHWDQKFERSIKVIEDYTQKYVDKALWFRESQLRSNSTRDINSSAESKSSPENEKIFNDEPPAPKRVIFIEELAKQTNDRKILRDQVITLFSAGRGTTSAFLSLFFWLLARHPDVVEKLHDEISLILKGEIPSYEQLKSPTYLRAVMDECESDFPFFALFLSLLCHSILFPRSCPSPFPYPCLLHHSC